MKTTSNIPSSPLPPHKVQDLLTKLQALPVRYIPEVEHFIDYLHHRHEEGEKSLTEGFFRLSAEAWDDE